MEIVDKKFWKNKRVLITGHTGFVGSWLYYILKKRKIDVYGISLPLDNQPSLFKFLNLKNDKKTFYCDINKHPKIENLIKKIKPNLVIHLAAQAIVLNSVIDPIKTYSTNIFGTLNILRSIQSCKSIKNIIFFTSDKVYKNIDKKKKFNEYSSLGGDDPYSGSKSASEHVINSYVKTFLKDRKILVLRSGNIFGGGDYGSYRIIPDLIKSIFYKKKIIIRNKKSIRPWQYVLDVLYNLIKLCETNKKNYDFFNIATNSDILKVEDIINLFKKKFNIKLRYLKKINFEKKNLFLDNKKLIRKKFKKSKYSTKEKIIMTINFYKNFHNKNRLSLESLMDKEIEKYEKSL